MKPSNQLIGQLPKERKAVFDPVFTNTRVDYFGPIVVKNSKRTRFTAGHNKCYRVVFTLGNILVKNPYFFPTPQILELLFLLSFFVSEKLVIVTINAIIFI